MTTPFADLDAITRLNEPMADHTSFGVGGPVSYFLEPRDWREVALVYQRAHDLGLRIRVLGRGCNTLVTDGPHDWAVVSTRRLDTFRRSGRRLEVGAGVALPKLLAMAEAWGLGGVESLAGIPGSVGGGVAMNAGGRYGAIADCLVGAVVASADRLPRWVNAGELGLTYRGSKLIDGRPFLLSATFEFEGAPPRRLHERWRRIVAEKRANQPMGARSAGCIFKNPPGHSAGRLIDQAGLKGEHVGDAAVSHKHANFIVNRGHATASDILQLIDRIVERVHERFGVRLELEVEVWSDDDSRGECHGAA